MISIPEFVARIVVQLRIFGWCVTGSTTQNPRQAVRDASLCALVERRGLDTALAGWWDHSIPTLWQIRVDRGLGTDRPPFWFALAGLAWADRAWWLDASDVQAGLA